MNHRHALILRASLGCVGGFLLAACAQSQRDPAREFTTVINRELAGDAGRLCATVEEFPSPDDPGQSEARAELHALAHAAIVEPYIGPDPDEKNSAHPSGKLFKLWRLTNEHDQSFFPYHPGWSFDRKGCYRYGQLRLAEVRGWREFTTERHEKAVSVDYTYQIDHPAEWTRDPELREAAEADWYPAGHIWTVVTGQNSSLRSITLVATPDGWKIRRQVYAPEMFAPRAADR